jgi:hypothetical protein
LQGVLAILAEGGGDVVPLVTEFYVFGSYARGASVVGDIDVDVEYERDEQRRLLEYRRLASGRNPRSDLMRELFRGQRIFQPHFGEREGLLGEVGGLVLLWRRGESLEEARERLHALRLDPAAGRATRDPVVPELEGLERWLPRQLRNQLSEAVRAGRLSLTRVELEDALPRSRGGREQIEQRWGAGNPLRRAALAGAAHLERLGVRGIRAWGSGWGALHGDRGPRCRWAEDGAAV